MLDEDMQARFAPGTFDRIAAVLHEDEFRTDFIRAAVEREIEARQKPNSPIPQIKNATRTTG